MIHLEDLLPPFAHDDQAFLPGLELLLLQLQLEGHAIQLDRLRELHEQGSCQRSSAMLHFRTRGPADSWLSFFCWGVWGVD